MTDPITIITAAIVSVMALERVIKIIIKCKNNHTIISECCSRKVYDLHESNHIVETK